MSDRTLVRALGVVWLFTGLVGLFSVAVELWSIFQSRPISQPLMVWILVPTMLVAAVTQTIGGWSLVMGTIRVDQSVPTMRRVIIVIGIVVIGTTGIQALSSLITVLLLVPSLLAKGRLAALRPFAAVAAPYLIALAWLPVGIGLLRYQAWSRIAAIVLCVIAIAQQALTFLPLIMNPPPGLMTTPLPIAAMLGSLGAAALLAWLLLRPAVASEFH